MSMHTEDVGQGTTNKSQITFTADDRVGVLKDFLEVFAKNNVSLSVLESRPGAHPSTYDFYVEFNTDSVNKVELQKLLQDIKAVPTCKNVSVIGHDDEVPWFPTKIADLDLFSQKVLAYGEELDSDHPGFLDEVYRKRRYEICAISSGYRHGQPVPRIDYTEAEIQTWRTIYDELVKLYPTHACKQFNHVFPLLEENCGYSRDSIPQLEDVSKFLKACTGWTLRPVTGLLSSRDFLNGFAFRVFHSTQYIRHPSKPFYTPEPDVCHELLGHVPMLADPAFAAFSQEIGIASLGASDEDIERLATCYWFTVEFGLCKQQTPEGKDEIKAFGAGLLSSFGELQYCLTDEPKLLPFSPTVTSATEYPITMYQPLYYVSESFETAKKQLQEFSKTLSRPFELYYNPITQCVDKLDSVDKITKIIEGLQQQLVMVTSALQRLS